MIQSIHVQNFGVISQLDYDKLGSINLIIGPNQSGKTTLVKGLYATIRAIEQYKRGKENKLPNQILSDKLYWTFQTDSLGNLVRKGTGSLSFAIGSTDKEEFSFSLSSSATKLVTNFQNTFAPTDANSVFIPAKEILSLREIIVDSRTRYNEFGFEDPYLDLALAARPVADGKTDTAFADVRKTLKTLLKGELSYSDEKKEWQFVDNNKRVYEISLTSEGVKKLSILSALLRNRYLSSKSVIIIDEVEANLHPSMISQFMEMIAALANTGIQFFITSHSYFVIKKLYIIAHQKEMDIPVLSFDENGSCTISNLKDERPKNAIIDESVKIYREEVAL